MTATLELSAFVDRLASPAGLRLSLALLHFLWQGVLIAAAAAVLMRIFRRSANRRYAIGVAAMALMAAGPVVTFALVSPPVSMTESGTFSAFEAAAFESEEFDALLAGPESGDAVEAAPQTWPERVRAWQPYALLAWLGGTAFYALRLAIGIGATRRFGRGRRPLPEAWQSIAMQVAARLGVKSPRVFLSDKAFEAVAVGLLRPMVVIPVAWLGRIPPELLEAVLAHELAHLRRHDLWVNLLQRCVEATLFYHPAVWWLSRRVRIEREYCCDETAALAVSGRATYARALEFVATEAVSARRSAASRPVKFSTALAAGMGGDSMVLLDRVRRVLGIEGRPRRGTRLGEGLLALAVPAALWAAVATVGPAVARADEAAETEEGLADVVEIEVDDRDFRSDEEEHQFLLGRVGNIAIEDDNFTIQNGNVLIDRPWVEVISGDVIDESEANLTDRVLHRVPILSDIPILGELFETPRVEVSGDVFIARSDIEEDSEMGESAGDDVREALQELRAELKSLRKEVEQLRSGEGHGKGHGAEFRFENHPLPPGAKFRAEVRPLPPGKPAAPSAPRAVKVDRLLFDHPGKPGVPPHVMLREFRPGEKGPVRIEARVFREKGDVKEAAPEKWLERIQVEQVDGKPRVFLFRDGKQGKPERIEAKPAGDEQILEIEGGRIHVRVLPPGEGPKPGKRGDAPADPRDKVIRRLEDELKRLKKELEATRTGSLDREIHSQRLMAQEQAEAAERSHRSALDAKLEALRHERAEMEESLGENHPKRRAVEAAIMRLREARERLSEATGEGPGEKAEARDDEASRDDTVNKTELIIGYDLDAARSEAELTAREAASRIEVDVRAAADKAVRAAEAERAKAEAAARDAALAAEAAREAEAADDAEEAAEERKDSESAAEDEEATDAASEDSGEDASRAGTEKEKALVSAQRTLAFYLGLLK